MNDDRELDIWIGKNIMALQGVGYYRRKSCFEGGWVACEKGEHKTCEGHVKEPGTCFTGRCGAGLYYTVIPGNTNSLHAVPPYSSDIGHAFDVYEMTKSERGFVLRLFSMCEGVYIYRADILGSRRPFDSFHSGLGSSSDKNPAKAICEAIKQAYISTDAEWKAIDEKSS